MKFWQKPNKKEEPDYGFLDDEKQRKQKENRKYLIVTLLNTVVIYGLYVILINAIPASTTVIVSVYLAALGTVSIGYVFYNRGFSRKNVTVDMLPDTMSEQEKEDFIEDAKIRMKRSKWCLTLIIPLVFTFFMDIFYLFIYLEYFAPIFGELF